MEASPLGMYLKHMQPYCTSPAASTAVEQLGTDAMVAVVQVLLNSDPSDMLMLNKLAESYQVGLLRVWC